MKIKHATQHHLSTLIELDTYAQTHASRVEEVKAWIDNNELYIVAVDSVIVAYGVFHYRFFQCGFIELIMVDESYRQQGIGSKLIDSFKGLSKTAKIFTSTNQSNFKMKNMLVRLGFVESGSVYNLDEGDPEIIYYFNKSK